MENNDTIRVILAWRCYIDSNKAYIIIIVVIIIDIIIIAVIIILLLLTIIIIVVDNAITIIISNTMHILETLLKRSRIYPKTGEQSLICRHFTQVINISWPGLWRRFSLYRDKNLPRSYLLHLTIHTGCLSLTRLSWGTRS